MSIFLCFFGIVLFTSVWLLGLRPYLSRFGKQRGGVNFFQGMLADLQEGGLLAKAGDHKAKFLCRIIWTGVILLIAGFVMTLL